MNERARTLTSLQQRLFDLSRRNRLLHFRPTLQTLDLTCASLPLSCPARPLQPEQVLTWNHGFKQALSRGTAIDLSEVLSAEALYVPGQLDDIRTQASRILHEYGCAPLRLVLCFLRWSNLKETPPPRFDSPLVLLPVRLTKVKGVKDEHRLEPVDTEAEVNPVLCYYLKQLYGIDLPEEVELGETALDELYASLAAQVQARDPAVAIDKIDVPDLGALQALAQRRVDDYRRRARLCDDATTSASIAPAPVEEPDARRWQFDLCRVTLGNFHSRRMSLVGDYDLLLQTQDRHPGLDAVFSGEPRPVVEAPPPLAPDESYAIVSCDPTQASALALARTGRSFIIQGPPGTGKSQTITNLIADYAARGRRVLFVCDKRAALDVVYHRLDEAGLAPLCCLIHDSQQDKKEFIQDLKQSYTDFLGAKGRKKLEAERRRALDALQRELEPLQHFHGAMQAIAAPAGIALRPLLERAIVLRGHVPELTAAQAALVPAYRHWHEGRPALERLKKALQALQGHTILARHALKRLQPCLVQHERPLEAVRGALPRLGALLHELRTGLAAVELPAESWQTPDRIQALMELAGRLEFLAARDLVGVLDQDSALGKSLLELRRKHAAKVEDLRRAQIKTQLWREKLSPDDTWHALQQARALEQSPWRVLRPSWWRLRALLHRCYDFSGHRVPPTWSHVLSTLLPEQRLQAELEELDARARLDYGLEATCATLFERIDGLRNGAAASAAPLRAAQDSLVGSPQGNQRTRQLLRLRALAADLQRELEALLLQAGTLSLTELDDELRRIEESLSALPGFLGCLADMGALPAPLLRAWIDLELTAEQVEAASARQTSEEVVRADPDVARYSGAVESAHVERVQELQARAEQINCELVRCRVAQQFRDRVRVTEQPAARLSRDEKELKTEYRRGRRELEHEFSKTMRYRAIRDLVSTSAGVVLRDVKPVWLMSPYSIADTLPLDGALFDVVVFDEASQVTLEEAVPALCRAPQVLIVGDEMQLPPTRFFAALSGDEEPPVSANDDDVPPADEPLPLSLLDHAVRHLPATMLGWHYRSRSEALISFSNAVFYQRRLLTVPDVRQAPSALTPIEAADPADAAQQLDALLARPVSFHFLQSGIYLGRRNAAEADYIAHLVRALLRRATGLSIGVVAFSEAQQGEIERGLERLAAQDADFRVRLDAEWEREREGQFVGLLVKNLENIQGDERDVILLSVCYAPGADGRMRMNFGPINQAGGERRLNVAFSRARQHMAMVTSIRAGAITNDHNDGARALKNYLRYSEAMSAGDIGAARRVLDEASRRDPVAEQSAEHSLIGAELADRLRGFGYEVDTGVGQSHFRCDLAVRRPGDGCYRLGILLDDRTDAGNLVEYAVLRPSLLRRFGWQVHRVLTKDWYEDPDGVLQTLRRSLTGDA